MVGPNGSGEIPAGLTAVVRSSTEQAVLDGTRAPPNVVRLN
jgi:hypothetical protein